MTYLLKKGEVFNSLTVIREVDRSYQPSWHSYRKVLCRCICWIEKEIWLTNIRRWDTKSCWCYKKSGLNKITHWLTWSNIYTVWRNIFNRCDNKNNSSYLRYGWRWITYDKKWENFEEFYKDMYVTYKKWLTLDRINNDWNYCKENCKWSTKKEQARNRSTNHIYKWKTLAQWCEEKNIRYWKVQNRIHQLWRSIERSLEINQQTLKNIKKY